MIGSSPQNGIRPTPKKKKEFKIILGRAKFSTGTAGCSSSIGPARCRNGTAGCSIGKAGCSKGTVALAHLNIAVAFTQPDLSLPQCVAQQDIC